MPYLLLVVEPPQQRAERGEAAGREVYQRMLDWAADLKRRGLLIKSSALTHSADGARVQVRDGRTRVIDGPFTECKEMIGGFFLIDPASHDEAVALAAECPAAEWCTVEVRATGPCYESR